MTEKTQPVKLCSKCDWSFDPPELELLPGGGLEDFKVALQRQQQAVRAALFAHLDEHARADDPRGPSRR